MNILLPVHHYLPHYSAGAELYTKRLAQWLQGQGHQVEVVCIEQLTPGAADLVEVRADTHAGVPVQRAYLTIAEGSSRGLYNHAPFGAWFRDHLVQRRPDLIHFQAGYLIGAAPIFAAAELQIPIVLTLHDFWYLCPRITLQRGDGSICHKIPDDPYGCAWCQKLQGRRYRIPEQLSHGMLGMLMHQLVGGNERSAYADRRATLQRALQLPDAIVSPSKFLASMFEPYVAPGRLHVQKLGIDLTRFQGAAPRADDGVLRIGYTGQIAAHKGVHQLVAAFRQLQPRDRAIQLDIYGGLESNQSYVAELRQLAEGDPRITFHGRYEHQNLPAILAGLDVTVTPSTWYENSPLAIHEAQAAGTPVVTAALGGMAELVRDEVDGLHFAANDPVDLARQLQRLVDQPSLLATLRQGVRPPRSIDDELQQIISIYASVVAGRGQPALQYAGE
jgi:glycosyltransferase involved in cell wall biosynthesis